PHRHQPDCLCPRRLRRLSRRVECDASAAHTTHERYQRDQLRHHRGSNPRVRIWQERHRRAAGDNCGRAGCGEHVRRISGQPANAGDVQAQRARAETTTHQPPTPRRTLMSANQVALSYLLASVFFILALRGLSHPLSARRGNVLGMVGMALAIVTTFAITNRIDLARIGLGIGAVVGVIVARRVQMTQMPELVAVMHSLVGLAAVLIPFAVVNDPSAFNVDVPIPRGNRLELFVGRFIGGVTFSGSIVAFGKLAGLGKYSRLFSSAPLVFKGQHIINLLLAVVMIGSGLLFFAAAPDAYWPPFIAMTAIAF